MWNRENFWKRSKLFSRVRIPGLPQVLQHNWRLSTSLQVCWTSETIRGFSQSARPRWTVFLLLTAILRNLPWSGWVWVWLVLWIPSATETNTQPGEKNMRRIITGTILITLSLPISVYANTPSRGQRVCNAVPVGKTLQKICATTGFGAWLDDPLYTKAISHLTSKKSSTAKK